MTLRSMMVEVAFDINDTPIGRLNRAIDDMRDRMLGGHVEKFESNIGNAGKETQLLGSRIGETTNQTKMLGSAADQAGRNIQRSGRDANNSGRNMKLLGSAAQTAARGFDFLGRKATNVLASIGRGLLSIPGRITSMLTHPLAMLGIGGGIAGVTKVGLDMVMDRQSMTTAFEVLLESREVAEERMTELIAFAGQTPYKRDEIFQASRVLEVFTKGALSTGEGLKMVGDIAAGTQQEFESVALWIGRMYDGMASGRKIGEATARLQEMGAIDGSQRQFLEDLAEAPGDIATKWEKATEVFGRFDGLMEKMSNNFQNLALGAKTFFVENVVYRWGKGVSDAFDPILRKFREWRGENKETIAILGQNVEDFARNAVTNISESFGKAFSYVKTNYLDNPEFMELDLIGKINWIFDDAKRAFDQWYQNTGKDHIKKIGSATTEFLGRALEASVPPITNAALKIGTEMGKGIWKGLEQVMADHPVLTVLLSTLGGGAFGARFGPWGAAIGGGAGFVGSLWKVTDLDTKKWVEEINQSTPEERISQMPIMQYYEGLPGHRTGLSSVPHDDYVARLHKGERVLTAEENKRYTPSAAPALRGGGLSMPNVNITVNVESTSGSTGTSSNVEADVKRAVREAWEEAWHSMVRKYPPAQEV